MSYPSTASLIRYACTLPVHCTQVAFSLLTSYIVYLYHKLYRWYLYCTFSNFWLPTSDPLYSTTGSIPPVNLKRDVLTYCTYLCIYMDAIFPNVHVHKMFAHYYTDVLQRKVWGVRCAVKPSGVDHRTEVHGVFQFQWTMSHLPWLDEPTSLASICFLKQVALLNKTSANLRFRSILPNDSVRNRHH